MFHPDYGLRCALLRRSAKQMLRCAAALRFRRFSPRLRALVTTCAGGFTLLEVIVAFMILSVALVALLQAFATGLHGIDRAQASAAAVMHARSKMDEIGQIIPLAESELSGEFTDGYRWQARIARVENEADTEPVRPIAIPFEVEVTVAGPRGAGLSLKTLRLGAAE